MVELVFRCPREACDRFFIGRYRQDRYSGEFNLFERLPITIDTPAQSEIIKKISPDFVEIFEEAYEAETRNLLLICGPGYRKALEFLIKDYIIRSHPDQADDIKKMNLARCISDYVSSDKVKLVSSRAVWLGNDETHYLRKWEGKDLQDLKGLIELTVHWIEMEELTESVLKDMPEGK